MQRKIFSGMIVFGVLWLLFCLVHLNNLTVYSMKVYAIEKLTVVFFATEKPLPTLEPCPETPPLLVGPLAVDFNQPLTLDSIRKENPELQDGGRFKPPNCTGQQKVAVIVPFRNRADHLKYWLYYLHPILKRQQQDYGIYIINQYGNGIFNRAKLMNVGFAEAMKEYDYNCFVFSDVDLVPMDDRNMYKCFSQPRHLSVAVDKFKFVLSHENLFGGVTALSKEQFLKVNGFPNRYWGWGGEDDEMYNRTALRGMSLSRPDTQVGRYRMIKHTPDFKNEPNEKRFDLLKDAGVKMDKDGINTLRYRVTKTEKDKLFTFITADIGSPT